MQNFLHKIWAAIKHLRLLTFLTVTFALATYVTAGSSANADTSLTPTGALFSNFYIPIPGPGKDVRFLQQTNGIKFDLNSQWHDAWSAFASTEFMYSPAVITPELQRSRFELREIYGRFNLPGWDIRIGRQIIPLSKMDAITPADFLIGNDFRRLTPHSEDHYVGSDGASFSWIPNAGDSSWAITSIYNWSPAESQLLLSPGQTSSQLSLTEAKPIPISISNSEFLLKASYITGQWDTAVSFFNGWNHLPELTRLGLTIEPSMSRVRSFSLNGSYSSEEYVWRIETAYTLTGRGDEPEMTAGMYQPSHLDTVIGVERPLGEKGRLQLQATSRYIPGYRDPQSVSGSTYVDTQINRGIAEANALAQGYERSWKAGLTSRISYGDADSSWNPELFVLTYPATDELLLRPMILYRWNQNLHLNFGAERFFGATNTALGHFAPYSSYFAEGRWSY